VPPYLTMPLMDNVLIPFQNGKPIDPPGHALPGGPAGRGAAGLGPGLGATYVLALVSERIGADLRTTTYEHLLKLSLEYFGGKRTGDLMARIGSESDRICVFLSLHLLDFATDVLMIIMTASSCLDQPVAGAGHAGAAALHRLDDPPGARPPAHGFEKIDRVWSK
jgi:ATP-binding cassette subfamily B protein